jgi:hypothetical protein
MRFIVMGMAKKESEAGPPPTPEAFAAMQKYNEDLAKAGILLAAEGLAPTSKGARVKFSGDKIIVVDVRSPRRKSSLPASRSFR